MTDERHILVPVDPGNCELDDSGWLLTFMVALHSRVADTHPIMGWADFDDEQRARIQAAWRAMIATFPTPDPEAEGVLRGKMIAAMRASDGLKEHFTTNGMEQRYAQYADAVLNALLGTPASTGGADGR